MNNRRLGRSQPARRRRALSRRAFLQWMMSSGLAVATLPQLVACGGGSSGGESTSAGSGNAPSGDSTVLPGGGTPGTAVTAVQRSEALAGIEAEFNRLIDTGTVFDPAAMVSYLQQQAAFSEVGYTPGSGCAWAVFTDGRKVLILNNLGLAASVAAPSGVRIAPASSSSLSSIVRGTTVAAAATLPGPDDPLVTRSTFRLINMWEGSAFWQAYPVIDYLHVTEDWVDADTIPRIGRIAQGLGFSMVQPDPLVGNHGTVDGLKTVSGDGVFFLTGSGGYMETSTGRVNGICTRTPASFVGAGYDADHDNGSLIYAVAVDDVMSGARSFHAITPVFIQSEAHKWSFPMESFVFLNTTGGGIDDWIVPLSDRGAGRVMGWSDAAEARTLLGVAQDFFELALATNSISPSWTDLSTEPRLRAYGLGETHSYLSRRGLIFTGTGTGANRLEIESGSFPARWVNQLRPSIEWIGITEANEFQAGEIQLQGQFGQKAGNPTVKIGTETQEIRDGTPSNNLVPELEKVADRPLSGTVDVYGDSSGIIDWQPSLIKLSLPLPGQRQAGMIQVWLDDASSLDLAPDRYSNVAHLTRWTIPFQINRTVGGSLLRSATVEVSVRAFVSGYRLWPDQPLDQQWQFVNISNMAEGNIGWSASGSVSRTTSGITTTVSWSGTGNFNHNSATELFVLGGILWINARRLNCSLEMNAGDGLLVSTDGGDPVPSDFRVGTYDADPAPSVPPLMGGPLSLFFEENWTLKSGSWILADNAESELGYDNSEIQITWPSVTPEFPPEPDRGGR